jgi:hypothetical protein
MFIKFIKQLCTINVITKHYFTSMQTYNMYALDEKVEGAYCFCSMNQNSTFAQGGWMPKCTSHV